MWYRNKGSGVSSASHTSTGIPSGALGDQRGVCVETQHTCAASWGVLDVWSRLVSSFALPAVSRSTATGVRLQHHGVCHAIHMFLQAARRSDCEERQRRPRGTSPAAERQRARAARRSSKLWWSVPAPSCVGVCLATERAGQLHANPNTGRAARGAEKGSARGGARHSVHVVHHHRTTLHYPATVVGR